MFGRRRFLFGASETVLTDSPQAYAALRLPVPELAALRQNREEDKREASSWGMSSVYPDGSRRGDLLPGTAGRLPAPGTASLGGRAKAAWTPRLTPLRFSRRPPKCSFSTTSGRNATTSNS